MIQLFKVRMSPQAGDNVNKVLYSGFIGQGQKVEEFEDLLKDELNSSIRPITLNSCTSAIELSLDLIGIGEGDEVISVAQTCFASNCELVNRKANIKWADIDPITGCIDPNSVKKLITNNTKAIIAVDWAGRICDFKTLKSFGIPVIEDAAHVWDSIYTNDCSSVERGDYICYSFQAIKYLTTGDGGILICPKEKENEARMRRWYGLDRTKGENFRCTQDIKISGSKFHMNDIAAAIGISNLYEARESVNSQKTNSIRLITGINNPNIITPIYSEQCSFWLFSLHVLNDRKQEFMEYLKLNNIASSPVHFRNDLYTCTKQYYVNFLPGLDSFTNTQVCIPNGWWLTAEDISHIIKIINGFK